MNTHNNYICNNPYKSIYFDFCISFIKVSDTFHVAIILLNNRYYLYLCKVFIATKGEFSNE